MKQRFRWRRLAAQALDSVVKIILAAVTYWVDLRLTSRALRVVLANAGWYTLPDATIDYPYGLRGTDVEASQLKRLLSKRVIVLLGDADTDKAHASLNQPEGAMLQGPHRFARGHGYFRAMASLADTLGAELNWSMSLAPGIAHDNVEMAQFAYPLLLRGPLSVN